MHHRWRRVLLIGNKTDAQSNFDLGPGPLTREKALTMVVLRLDNELSGADGDAQVK